MLKRRYGDRSEWKRVTKREYTQTYLDTEEFKGYVTLLKVHKVSEPLYVTYSDKKICIVDDGYSWLQHFPEGEHHSLTTMFNEKGEVVQWYLDITYQNGVENNTPWWDDLFLDIIILPTGEVIQKDADELDEALKNGWVNQAQYNLAWEEVNKINRMIENGGFHLMELAGKHLGMLLENLKTRD